MAKKPPQSLINVPAGLPKRVVGSIDLKPADVEQLSIEADFVKASVGYARQKLNELLESYKDLRTDTSDELDACCTKIEQMMKQGAEPTIKKVTDAARKLATTVDLPVSSVEVKLDSYKELEKDGNLVQINYNICIRIENMRMYTAVSRGASAPLKRLRRQQLSLKDKLEKVNQTILKIMGQIHDLPLYREAVEAELATRRLSSSAAGRNLLQQVRDKFDKQLKAIEN